MRISDWSSDVCSSDLNKEVDEAFLREVDDELRRDQLAGWWRRWGRWLVVLVGLGLIALAAWLWWQEEQKRQAGLLGETLVQAFQRSEEHTSELQSLMRTSYAVFCLKQKNDTTTLM